MWNSNKENKSEIFYKQNIYQINVESDGINKYSQQDKTRPDSKDNRQTRKLTATTAAEF